MTPLLERCTTLGREFGRRRMTKHVDELRLFYQATKAGAPSPNSWDEAFVDHWFAILRLPPFESLFELREKQADCVTCHRNEAMSSRRTEMVFPGGSLMRCDTCGVRWLEPE